MNSRGAQDVVLRLLADGPYRAAALAEDGAAGAGLAPILSRVDRAGLDRFGRFLCRHYYRERVVHYFKYSRALVPLTARPPEAVLKTPEFTALMPQLVLGESASAEKVLALVREYLSDDGANLRRQIPYWDDLIAYQSVFFLSDARPEQAPAQPSAITGEAGGTRGEISHPSQSNSGQLKTSSRGFPARAKSAAILEMEWDLPAVLPALLRPFTEVPMPPRQPARLLFARSANGEVTVLRLSDPLKQLLDNLTGEADPASIAARLGLDCDSVSKTLARLERVGAVVAQGSFSASHVGSEA